MEEETTMNEEDFIIILNKAISKVKLAKTEETLGMGPSKERDMMNASFEGARVALEILLEEVEAAF